MTELSPEAKKLMQIAREDFSPNAERVTAMRGALQQRIELGRGNGGNSAGGMGGGAAGTSTFVKLLGIGVVATAAVLGVLTLSAREPARTAPAGAHRALVSVPVQQAQPQPAPQQGARNALATTTQSAAPALSPRVARVARDATAESESPPARMTASTRPRVAHAARTAPTSVPMTTSTATTASTSTAASTTAAAAEQPQPEEPAAQAAKLAPPVDDSLTRELALLTRARAALAHHDPHTALELTDEHAAQFANGTMRQERVATRVLALCALGRRNDAIAAKHELERIAPRSPHLMRLRTSCAAEDASREVN